LKKLLVLLPALFIILVSCSNSNKKFIVGKWKMTEMNLLGMDEDEKKEAVEDLGIEFRSDRTCTLRGDDDIEEGTYTYDKGSDKVTIKSAEPDGGEHIYSVSWKGDDLVLSIKDGSLVFKRE
jgi:hypothetical protein